MNNMRKIVLTIMILLTICIIVLCIYILNKGISFQVIYEEERADEVIYNNEEVTNPTMYYTVVKCINKYLQNCSTAIPTGLSRTDQEEANMTEEERVTRIYNELSREYIEENNITINNVREYVHTAENYLTLYPINMNVSVSELNQMISSYGVYGRLKDSGTGEFVGYGYIMVIIDTNNMTFAIKPYIKNNINSLDDINLTTEIANIKKNSNNEFSFETITNETLMKNYFNNFKMYINNDPEIAYQYLDNEYREKRFGNLETFMSYIKGNNIIGEINSYQVIQFDDYTQYVCIDSNNNYIIFKESSTMNYRVLLDTHTVDLPQFIEQYNEATVKEKVAMNINKIVEALNMKDYRYVYNKLSKGFKQNYFKTQNEFIKFAEKYFVNNNSVTFNKYSEQTNNTYVCNITLKDKNGKSSLEINMDILMRLEEGTDFVITFSGLE